MAEKIVDPARCEVRGVIRILLAKGSSAAEIHRELCLVYGPEVMSEKQVRKWYREFRNGRTNIHDERRSGRPSTRTNDIVDQVNQKLRSYRRLTISGLANEFPNVARTSVYRIVTEQLQYTSSVRGGFQKCSLISTKSKECVVHDCFWSAIDKMEMICFPILLRATRRGYRPPTQNRNNSQCSVTIQVHPNQKSLSNLRTRIEN